MDEAFIRAIVANPDEDTPRLVYADWLDETGDSANADRAEFIRLQCRLGALPADSPERPELVKREESLLKTYAKRWAEPFREIITWWTYRRGFIESAAVRTEGMRKTFHPLFSGLIDRTPLQEVILFHQTDDFRCLLPAAPLMGRLKSFSIRHGFLYSGGRLLRPLFESPHLAGLTRLELEGSRNGSFFRPRVLSAILQWPVLEGLTDLSLSDYLTAIHPTVLRTLARSRTLSNLKRLSIESTEFDQPTLRGILRAPYANNLEVLELRHCQFDEPAWAELLSPNILPSLKRLLLGGASVRESAIEEARERFGPDAVDTEQEFPARPWYYSWWTD